MHLSAIIDRLYAWAKCNNHRVKHTTSLEVDCIVILEFSESNPSFDKINFVGVGEDLVMKK